MPSSSICSLMTDDSMLNNIDPLEALHDHILATNPDMDLSVLTDDEMITLLKSAKDPKELSYLNMSMSKQQLSKDGSSTIAFDAPSVNSPSSTNGSQFSNASSSQRPY